ncbi:ABC transporter substrate-binding protein [Oceanicola granulosus]|nr:extracellular solute-binding protein [Oceanicola granulosus]
MKTTFRRTGLALVALSAAAPAWAQDPVELTFLVDNGPPSVAQAEALAAAYTELNPHVTFDIELRVGSIDGDNLVKTRLATEEMADIFLYNSGSLFQALAPTRTIVELTDQPFLDVVSDSFEAVVTADGGVYGVPIGPGFAGGIMYNRAIYDELGLEVPLTWDDFMANNAAIDEAGYVPIAQTYGDTWSAQLLVLGDYFNVEADSPGFAERYTNNEAKFATDPAALRSFERLEEAYEAGYFNEDFGAATYDDGIRMIATGEAAHYPILSLAIDPIAEQYPDAVPDIGFFAQPGDDPDKNGLTIWLPNALYVPQASENIDEAVDFLAFVASQAGCQAQIDAGQVSGPYLIEGCQLPEDVPQATRDLVPYFNDSDLNLPALEFLSPVKGPALPQLTVEVGSGIRSAAEAAAIYDEDVKKAAQQLGLPNW